MHFAHKRQPYNIQELSIVTSCNLLKTKLFLPPFVEWNNDTEKICIDNGITILGKENWKSLDKEEFNSSHSYWFFHSWRHNIIDLINKIKKDKNKQ